MTQPPETEEGWYVLHDFRRVDWDAWREAPQRERDQAIEDGVAYLEEHEQVADAPEGATAVFSVLGHKADLLVIHFRPTMDALSTAERRFERTALAGFTDQPTSYVSVTEVSGYVSDEYFTDDEVDEGLRRYIEGKLTPDLPEDGYVSFYPMNKRRGEEQNWYTLPFEERAEMMADHGVTGREYAGSIDQVIASSLGFDDYEWGVTLFSDDPAELKDIVYEMRFDEASARYGEFGPFYIGRRFPPTDLDAFLRGEPIPAEDQRPEDEVAASSDSGPVPTSQSNGHPGSDQGSEGEIEDVRAELAELDIYAGKPHGEDVFATVLYSETTPEDLAPEIDDLRGNFEHYETHVKTAVYGSEIEAEDAGSGTPTRTAVVSIWETASAAETAAGFLSDVPGVIPRDDATEGFGTMGMFYTVKPEYRGEFLETFGTVGDTLAEMDGHRRTNLLVNHADENDMFIASEWESKDDAMAFFGSDDFRETVQWGRDVLRDRPRHVFLT